MSDTGRVRDWPRPWPAFACACLCLWLIGCAPASANPASTGQVVAVPVIMAAQQEAPDAVPSSTPLAPKPGGETVLTQLRDALLPTATMTPTATAVPSATPLPSPTPCAAPGSIVQGSFENSYAGPLSYRVYLPPCYGLTERTYPVLYMLPGNVFTDSIWDDLGLDEAAEAGMQGGELPPFIIVMVSGGYLADNTSGGPGSYEAMFMEQFIPHIEQTYCAWPEGDGRALGGMSRGGYWALEIAFRHADQFASVGGHSAALLDAYGGAEVNPEETGLVNDLGDLRIYLDIGDNDWVINNVQRLHERMDEAGIAHQWILNEGRHEETYWGAHVTDYLSFYAAPWPVDPAAYSRCRPLAATSAP